MPHLTLTLLGPPRIERDGQTVSLDTRKATALLAYLTVTGQRHSRDALAALLYPEYDQGRARATLRRTLSSLKSAIGDAALVIDRETVALAPEADLWCDVGHFQRLLAQCHSHGHGAHDVCPRCLAPLHEAAALYQDDFLAGFTLRDSGTFDEWQFFETERLRRELNAALERLVRLLTVEGDLTAAIGQARRLLTNDPLHEPARRILMLLYVWTGQEQAALRQYRECVQVLSKELGVAPLPQTTQVYEAIKERRTPPPPARLRTARAHSAAQASATIPPPPPNAPPPVAPAGLPAPLPLMGRTAEWAALRQLYAHVQADGRLAALEGEPGIGKTRLAEQFLASVQGAGGSAIAARCYEGETGLAYGVWIEMLRAALADPEIAQRRAAAPDSAVAEAARLLPELAAGRGLPPASSLEHPGAQAHFLEGLGQVLQALAGPAGVLFLDDLQWADDASLQMLSYLVHRLAGRPLLLLAAWRSEDSPTVQRLRSLARAAQRAGLGQTLSLGRLQPDDILALAATLPGAPETQRSRGEWLVQQSEGLPLFVAEYLTAWRAGEAPAETAAIPQGVRSLLHGRLAAVDEAGQQLLATAAVIGRSFDVETLRAASGRSEEEIVDSLEHLARQGLVRETGPAGAFGGYDFSHEQLRGLVYAETGLARRRLLHRRVAEALLRQPRSAHALGAASGQIAHHLQLAGREKEAADYFWQAGQHARTLYANAEALAYFEAALALGYVDVGALYEAIADLHTLSGRYGAARAAYEQAAAQATDSEQPARIEHKLALLHHRQGNWAQAESHFQAAHEAWPAGDRAGLAHLLADRSLNAHRQGQKRRAETLAEEGLHEAGQAQDAAGQARAHNALGILARSRGDLTAAIGHLTEGLALAETLNDLAGRVAALNNLALVRQEQGDTAAAIRLTETALDLCTAQGDRHREAALRNNLADLLYAAGRPDAAMEQLKQAVAVFAAIGETASGPWQPEIWKLVAW